ncbi:MAG: hypothetical protein OQK79_09355 [Rhodanobacter sp.]|jgi:hypothetical protein|nr:hypothetical protein [Rhodanobacter sp.]
MKRFQTYMALGLLAVSASAAATDSWSLNAFKSRVLPVLVQVDASGKVTNVSPSTELSPRFGRLLHSSLDEMISKPAMVHGRPTASQFVINLDLQVTPRDDGHYDAKFAYVSASPVPAGSWYWSHEDGHRLALISRDSLEHWHRPRFNSGRDFYPMPNRAFNPRMISTPAQTAVRGAPVRARGH